MAGNRVNDFIEDLKGKKVLTKQELRALGKRVDLIVDKTEGLIDGLNEKSGIVGKMLVKSIFGPKGELALEILDEIENYDSDNSGSYSSSTEYEDESEESEENEQSEEEENAESSQEMDPPIVEDTKPAGSCEPSNLTEDKKSPQDLVNDKKGIAHGMLGTFFADLKEKKVLKEREIQTLGETVNVIVDKTEGLVGDLTEKTQMVGKMLKNHFFSSKSEATIKILDEDEKDESGKIKSFSSSTVFQVTQASQINVLKLCPCIHFKEPKTIMAHEIYPVMEKKSRMRLALIICNRTFDYLSEREGCEKDISGMRDLLENLGYSVVIKENLTAQEMKVELKHFATRPEHRFSDSTFLVFMSHGILDGICGTKHREEEPDVLHDDTIFQIFNNRNCRNLKDKPKVIIMQACRGKGNGAVWVTDVGEACAWPENQPSAPYIFSDAVQKTHVEKDFIAFKSSTPHNVSWRLNTDGSVFISHLIRYFKMYSCCHHLEEIFRKVQYSFETPNIITQMPTIERLSMTRYFYLFPGN
ncbi:caspase-12-like isoform X1 [Acinonyx jubatus]|uniref:Caspase-12-like isoform X1 n=2 Tax=Acinonyx jubatus TaxID=32536 RepID=A0A6I9ZSR0_ACIJB|nr:caspase-12-like isoform X1 [Acinonyx jubatus]XP_053060156.1 caspase-12-like isoform X1 [Acinonyx jubatus]